MSKNRPTWINNVRQLIHWQYSKLISEAICGKRDEFPMVMSEFKKLEAGDKNLSPILRDNKLFLKSEEKCVYCGSLENIQLDHIIPLSKGGPDTYDNLIYACKKCNLSKSNKNLIEWYGEEYSFKIPSIAFAKYLKLVYQEHKIKGTLNSSEYFSERDIDTVGLAKIFQTEVL